VLKPASATTALAGGPLDDGTLRQLILDFLTLNEQPARWTFFRPAPGAQPAGNRHVVPPDVIVDIGGRIAYVAIRRQGGGPLPAPRAAALALAQARGAACFVVRSLPDMERVLWVLGVRLRPRGRLIDRRKSQTCGNREDADVGAT
jgi:hypothetical protein